MTLSIDFWNALHPVGTPVVVYPGARPKPGGDNLDCRRIETVTTSPAWITGFGKQVVLVRDYAGWITLTHVDRREDSSC